MLVAAVDAFCTSQHQPSVRLWRRDLRSTNDDDLSELLTARLPTSVEDQVRQASESIKRASQDGIHRHGVRLLLPVIGATELDDWPGGARQMMEAAYPLVTQIMNGVVGSSLDFKEILLDQSDGVYALLGQASEAKKDSCSVLLPSADNLKLLQDMDSQVGPTRDYSVVNSQWKRTSDFGSFLGVDEKAVNYVESFSPSFSLTNLVCEGESIRILRNYPGPWRVFGRVEKDGEVDWLELGNKAVVAEKADNWDSLPENQKDGGLLFNYGQPSYQEVADMLKRSPNYTPKSPAERAAAAFNFIKDTL